MNRELIDRARAFWRDAQISPEYPVDIEQAACWSLPLGIVHLPGLNTSTLASWIGRFDDPAEHPLHAALLARSGRGLVLVDGRDDPSERRLSIAHECAHFILDYLDPRSAVLSKLGPGVLEVLDGHRPPTLAERVDSLLAYVPLGLHVHLVARDLIERSREQALHAESQADALALELIAPAAEVRRRSASRPLRADVAGLLVSEFGLPDRAAEAYSRSLVPVPTPSFRAWLGV